MCGIAGYRGPRSLHSEIVNRTLHHMKHRGPDAQRSVSLSSPSGDHISLLHARLSIIDLDPRSHQPFVEGPLTLIYNGEIYNFKSVQAELKKRGHHFATSSDTEVLAKAWLEDGPACLDLLEGMWAFAIYDSRDGNLHLVRDRFGEKPLYYAKLPDGFYFGSEIKFIQSLAQRAFRPNIQHLSRYIVNGYKALYKSSETFFEEIQEVPIASHLILTPKGDLISKGRYWQIRVDEDSRVTQQDAIEGVRERLVQSVGLRLTSDVPIAFCLSGGVDSSSLVSIAAKHFDYDVHTFSIIDEDERYNEFENIKATLDDLHCKHSILPIPKVDALSRLQDLVRAHDGPLATISYYVHSFISEAVASEGYKVVVSGTGADELLTGYYDHFNLHLAEVRHHARYATHLQNWQTHIAPLVRNPHLQKPDLYFENPTHRDHIYLNNDVFSTYLKQSFAEGFTEQVYTPKHLLKNRMLNELFHEGTRVILHEDDLNSMKYSLENRSPFLDRELMEYCTKIPTELLIQEGYGKYILRQAVGGILNDRVRLDRHKKGFNASIHSMIDFGDKRNREYFLDRSPFFDFVDRRKMEELFAMKPMPNSFSKCLFNLLNAKIFLDQTKTKLTKDVSHESVASV